MRTFILQKGEFVISLEQKGQFRSMVQLNPK